jgi:hypothetical protein
MVPEEFRDTRNTLERRELESADAKPIARWTCKAASDTEKKEPKGTGIKVQSK